MQKYSYHTIIIYACLLLGGLGLSQAIFSQLSNNYKSLYNAETVMKDAPQPITETIINRFQVKCISQNNQCTLFAHQHLVAALYRLDTIQYIGKYANLRQSNTITNRLHTITTLSPHRVGVYSFAVLMGPIPKSNNKDNHTRENTLTAITWENTVTIGEAGIRMVCDNKKVNAIKSLSPKDLISAIQTKDQRYREPCPDYRLPQQLAFDYYYYLGDYAKAIHYYKIAAMHSDVPKIALTMPDIIARQYGIVAASDKL